MQRRSLTVLATALVLVLALAGPAFGAANGEGWLGETDDKLVTLIFLGVTAFFPLLALVLTLREHQVDKRQEDRKHREDRERVKHRAA